MGMAHGVPLTPYIAFGRVPVNNLTLRDMDKQLHDLDIIHDVGINANTIRLTDQKMKHLNSKRPARSSRWQGWGGSEGCRVTGYPRVLKPCKGVNRGFIMVPEDDEHSNSVREHRRRPAIHT